MALKKKVTMAILGVATAAVVAGGGLKMYSRNAIEIKRLWVDKEYRGKRDVRRY